MRLSFLWKHFFTDYDIRTKVPDLERQTFNLVLQLGWLHDKFKRLMREVGTYCYNITGSLMYMCVEDSQKSEKSRAALKLKMKSHRTFSSSGSFGIVLSSLCYISMTTGRKPHSNDLLYVFVCDFIDRRSRVFKMWKLKNGQLRTACSLR